MNRIKSILLILTIILLPMNIYAQDKEEAIDIPEIVLHHLSDAYEWHIGGDISIPLPIIVKAEQGWFFGTAKAVLPDGIRSAIARVRLREDSSALWRCL